MIINQNKGFNMKKTQANLAGKVGCCPQHFSAVVNGDAHLSGKKARKLAKIINSDPVIWIEGASKDEIKKRGDDIVLWKHS